MAQQLFSPSWYRVAKLTPLCAPTQIHRHQ
jgi:hypothetical protein